MLEADESARISINLRVDKEKFVILERLRKSGFGLAETERNRSDVYNEVIGYGLQLQMIKQELGDRDFEKMWKIFHKINLKKLNYEELQKYLGE